MRRQLLRLQRLLIERRRGGRFAASRFHKKTTDLKQGGTSRPLPCACVKERDGLPHMAPLTPMMQQYLEVKQQYPDAILMFRLGDFYEMFFEDAKTASRELELVLTGRDCGQEERAPMCGVPFHSADSYIARLVAKGYKVAICEQLEDPALAKGIVKRDVIRVVTPGTVIENSMLDESRNNYLACVCVGEDGAGLCFADVSTGEVHLTDFSADGCEDALMNEFGRYMPSEALMNAGAAVLPKFKSFLSKRMNLTAELLEDEQFDLAACTGLVLRHFQKASLDELELSSAPDAVRALGAALVYLKEAQKAELDNIRELDFYSSARFMRLDLAARRNLELTRTMRSGEKRGTLLWVLDRTKTAMGKRLIRSWVEQPLLSCAQISRRLNAVDELFSDTMLRRDEIENLTGIYDLERLMTRIAYGTANARELRSLSAAIEKLAPLRARLEGCKSAMLCEIFRDIDPLEDLFTLVDSAIVEEPPFTVREGGMIKPGFHEELDSLHALVTDGKGFLAQIEQREQERTGIKKLKIGYNRVFGYYIEVSNSYKELVPEDYIRKQTLSNCERFITQELKELESKVLGAQERMVQLEYQIFSDVRTRVADELYRVQRTAHAVARLDVLCSFAQTAVSYDYTRPVVDASDRLEITDGRHPVVERMLEDAPFVPNDTALDCKDYRCAIITGPNMAGKSTYMRQVALITLMAQIGSFVPARSAQIGVVDSIFTRVGASDDLAAGQSTFMVEMSEVASILQNATAKSLILLDEIGRGTSTYDGMSIARAVLEFCADSKKLGAKTLFATHYHELTELENQVAGVKNYNIAVKKRGDEITFLRRIIRGGADGSYGVEVAKLAGVPVSVVKRARVILKALEGGARSGAGPAEIPDAAELPEEEENPLLQISIAGNTNAEIMEQLKNIDVNTLTPIEALTMLHELVRKAKR